MATDRPAYRPAHRHHRLVAPPDGHAHDLERLGEERRRFTETKVGFKTSELPMAVVAIAAVLVATCSDGDDTLTQNDGWRYAAFIAVASIVSRGLAKLGVREPYTDGDRLGSGARRHCEETRATRPGPLGIQQPGASRVLVVIDGTEHLSVSFKPSCTG